MFLFEFDEEVVKRGRGGGKTGEFQTWEYHLRKVDDRNFGICKRVKGTDDDFKVLEFYSLLSNAIEGALLLYSKKKLPKDFSLKDVKALCKDVDKKIKELKKELKGKDYVGGFDAEKFNK